MNVYTPRQLQELLNIGRPTAYKIMREYGFRTGYTDTSPLRITEEGVKKWADRNRMTSTSSPKTPSNG